jgi:hypothetical protein
MSTVVAYNNKQGTRAVRPGWSQTSTCNEEMRLRSCRSMHRPSFPAAFAAGGFKPMTASESN